MLIILSPAKIQNFQFQDTIQDYTLPQYVKEAEYLANILKSFSADDLRNLLKVNRDIARHTADSYYNWSPLHTLENAKQALLVYNGEVFHGLNAQNLSVVDMEYAQNHLRIISGLYGVLRPLDLIQSYRLEMNTKLKNQRGNDLYSFWKEDIPVTVLEAVKKSGEPEALLNLASNEYSKSVTLKSLGVRVIDFDFLEGRDDGYKPITIYTKKARGLMARYVIKNRIENVEDLKGFDLEGYWFNSGLSSQNKLVFTRG